MKIAFIGAHRVGKTTLAEKIGESLHESIFIPEPYVELEARGQLFSKTPGLEDFSIQLEHAIETSAIDEPDVIFDRSPLDLMAYVYVTGGATAARNFYSRVKEAIEELDLLVFVPIEQPDLIGCPDNEFPDLRKKVNDLIEEWTTGFDVEILTARGTLAQREEAVLRTVLEMSED
jgi:hypothetical protein